MDAIAKNAYVLMGVCIALSLSDVLVWIATCIQYVLFLLSIPKHSPFLSVAASFDALLLWLPGQAA